MRHRRSLTVLAAVGTVALLVVGLPATVLAARAEAGADMTAGMGSMLGARPHLSGHWAGVAGSATGGGRTRTIAIAAEPVGWTTVSGRTDVVTGAAIGADVAASSSGTVCVYRQYTDTTFSTPSTRAVDQRYLGVLGPVLHAEVGDTLDVVLENRCGFPVSIHPTGLRTGKNDEGAAYQDVTMGSQKDDDAVASGARFTYVWQVPARSGPGSADGSSIAWQYSTGAGGGAKAAALTGVVVVTRKGDARADGTPRDVDSEFVIDAVAADADSAGILHDSINGYRAGSLPMVSTQVGRRVRWYVLDSGTAATTVRWFGDTLESGGRRVSGVTAEPGLVVTADMAPDDFGWWLLDTGRPGGHARYVVTP